MERLPACGRRGHTYHPIEPKVCGRLPSNLPIERRSPEGSSRRRCCCRARAEQGRHARRGRRQERRSLHAGFHAIQVVEAEMRAQDGPEREVLFLEQGEDFAETAVQIPARIDGDGVRAADDDVAVGFRARWEMFRWAY